MVILDFGLIAELAPQHAGEASYVSGGTPAYMAPEEAAGETPSEAGDWYAIGVTLYEALTGTLPFDGRVTDLFVHKRTIDPPPPAHLVPDVPADLEHALHGTVVPRSRAAPVGERCAQPPAAGHDRAASGDRAGAGSRAAIRRPRGSARSLARGLPSGQSRSARRRYPSAARQASARARWSAASSARSPAPMRSSCSRVGATKTSRCRTRRSTAWSTISAAISARIAAPDVESLLAARRRRR